MADVDSSMNNTSDEQRIMPAPMKTDLRFILRGEDVIMLSVDGCVYTEKLLARLNLKIKHLALVSLPKRVSKTRR